jgi:hypothetical protein
MTADRGDYNASIASGIRSQVTRLANYLEHVEVVPGEP